MDITVKITKWLVLSVIPIMWIFHQFFYAKNPKYYFFLMRLLSKWRDTTWEVNAEYTLDKIDDVYSKIELILKENYKNDKYKRTVNMIDKKLYEFGIFNGLISDDFNSGEYTCKKLSIRLSPLNVTLNTAEEKLRELRELFNKIERVLHVKQTTYNLNVYFKDGKNPFFGLMVQRLGRKNISHFECVFPMSVLVSKKNGKDNKRHNMRVFKEKLSINESSFDIIEETAKRVLSITYL